MSSSSRGAAPDVSILNGVSVLVVEDTWSVAKAMKATLQQLGMRVMGPTATTAEARRLVAVEKPKLALIDVNLKQEMACDLIDELQGQGIHVVVVSGYAVPPIAQESAVAFLQKPFNGAELIAAMCAIVGRLP
jgi:DNA-binding response OmpR family regulator